MSVRKIGANNPAVTTSVTPSAHASTHATGGSDPVSPASIGAVPATRSVASGTGLTGGGNLSADRTLAVSYGTTAGTAAQGNDSRLSDSRTPTAHAASHATAGSDPISPASIGAETPAGAQAKADAAQAAAELTASNANSDLEDALVGYVDAVTVPNSRQVASGTGLTGGGDLSVDRTLAVSYGTSAGTAAQGNDSRIVNAVPNTRLVSAGTGLTGGGALSADRTLAADFGTAAGKIAQGNDSRIVNAVQTTRTLTAGYGLTGLGDLSADRTPAVSLTTAGGSIPSDVAVAATTITTVYTVTLPAAGTYQFSGGIAALFGANAGTVDATVAVGTAVGTLSGQYSGSQRQNASTYATVPVSGLFVCTTAGTLLLRCYSTAVLTAKATSSNGYSGGCGLVVVRIV